MKPIFAVAAAVLVPGYLTLAKAADQPVRGPRFAQLTYEQLNVYQKPLGEQISFVVLPERFSRTAFTTTSRCSSSTS
jgi:hypothetical protein